MDVKEAMESNDEIVILTYDLQKTLETPSLTASEAFYKRKLWTYNFCVYNEVSKQGNMYNLYMWNESNASRAVRRSLSVETSHFTGNENSKNELGLVRQLKS